MLHAPTDVQSSWKEQYEKDGYVIIRNAIDADLRQKRCNTFIGC